MVRRFLGPLVLLAAIVIGDQIRINRPDHKFRLIFEVDTPAGLKTASGVFSVHPDRGYVQGNATQTKGDAIPLDLGSKTLMVLMAHERGGKLDLDDINFVAVRAFNAAGQRAAFKRMDRLIGAASVTGELLPAMAMLADRTRPDTMRAVALDGFAAAFGAGASFRGMRVEIVPNGLWPVDVGGAFGEPVTRQIAKVLPWAASPDAAATALKAAGWTSSSPQDGVRAFTR